LNNLPKTKLIKEKYYFLSGSEAGEVVEEDEAFSPLQHDFAEADLSEHEDAHDFEQDSPDLASAFTSLVSAAFLEFSFFGSLSKFTISVLEDAAIRFWMLSAPKVTKPKIASDNTSFFILLNLRVKF
jgi:hypothetical protein